MNGDKTTFKRYEKKYIIDSRMLGSLYEIIKSHVVPDRFHRYTICNIYYDTENYELIRRSIQKPVYKEKLRLRRYGTSPESSRQFVELKKKYKSEVFKRRAPMNSGRLDDCLNCSRVSVECAQVLDEIKYFMSVYNPRPSIYIAYERSAFSGKDDPELRITFDENIRFRTCDLDFADGDYGTSILDGSAVIMEIKTRGSMPLWLSGALDELEIYPNSFSKYGYCYENYILKNIEFAAHVVA